MRVISQDGTWDIPYEKVAIQRVGSKIYFLNANLMGVEESEGDECIAKYSTVEKAINVIDMFRKAYKEYSAMNITTNGIGQALVKINDTEENRKFVAYIANNLTSLLYFQFPEDSEV